MTNAKMNSKLSAMALAVAVACTLIVHAGDWILDPSPYKAEIREDGGSIVLENGLVRREILLNPAPATVSLACMATGEQFLRTTAPEAFVTLDGVKYPVGGLEGAPIDNFLLPEWKNGLEPIAGAFRFAGWKAAEIRERFKWKKRPEWLAEDLPWPPKGKRLVMTYRAPSPVSDDDLGQIVLEEKMVEPWGPDWREILSSATDRTSCRNEGKPGEIYNRIGTYAYLEHDWPDDAYYVSAVVSTEEDFDRYCWGPALAVFFKDENGGPDKRIDIHPRAAAHEYAVESDDRGQFIGRFDSSKSAKLELFMRKGGGWMARMSQKGGGSAVTFLLPDYGKPYKFAVGKLGYRRRGLLLPPNIDRYCMNPPGDWIETKIHEIVARKRPDTVAEKPASIGVEIDVNYEIYDGAPIVGKYLTIRNLSNRDVTVNSFAEEYLKVVERNYAARERGFAEFNFYVESNYYMDMMEEGHSDANRTARYLNDPNYATQVCFDRKNAAILEVGSDVGPDWRLKAGESFETPYAWMLLFDSTDRQRRQLALCRFYRILAPWTQENPLLFHNTDTSVEGTRLAIDQCAETGIDICAESFRGGFDLESTNAAYRAAYAELGRHARNKGVYLGAYALSSSRHADVPENMVDDPSPDYGLAPCMASSWGLSFFKNVGDFLCEAEMGFIENDGPYWRGCCSSTNHPGHRGRGDSQYAQWLQQAGLYRRCRANGVYVNQPAWYFMEGGSATGVGYLEEHWSLPRDQQAVIERMDIYDGLWNKSPSMSWSFIPLDVYHGGGSVAMYEPMKDHLPELDIRFANEIGCGLKAIIRGHRVYDAPETYDLVKKWTAFRRRHRAVLDGDYIRMRRPDGRDWDGWVMANARADGEKAIAFLFNPTAQTLVRKIRFPLYYAGLPDVEKEVEIPARGYTIVHFPEGWRIGDDPADVPEKQDNVQ